ncbi:MAG: hypothetical protein ING70_11025 [Rhodocyclaceae bacterium]|nr:hypothetical protein [Rhodocyclaceae bacterium]MCA3146179.1 hypothetical protein [Rhodocyclaceae bacterium]
MDGYRGRIAARRAAAGWAGRATAAAVMVALAAGCTAPGASRPGAAASQRCDALHQDTRLDPLRGRMRLPIVLGQALPVEQLAERGRVSGDAERDAIKALEAVRAECRRLAEAAFGPLPRYRSDSEDRVSETLADLYTGAISWGQFNKTLLHIGERDRTARENLDDELAARERWRAFHDFGGN